MKQFNYSLEKIPLIQYINDPGIYVWLMFFLLMLLIKNKEKVWIPLMPLLLTFICCLNAPTINYNTRYVFPIVFAIIPLIAFYSSIIKTNDVFEIY